MRHCQDLSASETQHLQIFMSQFCTQPPTCRLLRYLSASIDLHSPTSRVFVLFAESLFPCDQIFFCMTIRYIVLVYEEQIEMISRTLAEWELLAGLDVLPCVLPNSAGVPRDAGIGALFYICHAELITSRPNFDGYLLLHDGKTIS